MSRLVWRSLSWEYLRLTFPPVLACAGFFLLLPWIGVQFVFRVPQSAFDSTQYFAAYFGLSGVLWAACAFTAQTGLRQRLFLLPMSNRAITSWLMSTPLVTLIVGNLLGLAALTGLYGADWPIGRPLLYQCVLCVMAQIGYWHLRESTPGKAILWSALCVLTAVLMAWRFLPHGWQAGITVNPPWTLAELTLLGAAIIGCAWSANRCTQRGRTHEHSARTFPAALQTIEQSIRTSSWGWSRVGGYCPLSNQLWRQRGIQGLLGAALLTVLCSLFLATAIVQGEDPIRLTSVFVLLTSIFCGVFLGLVLGTSLRVPSRADTEVLSSFLSTRPVSSAAIWHALHGLVLRASVGAWVFLLLCFAAVVSLLWLSDVATPQTSLARWWVWQQFGALGLLVWCLNGLALVVATASLAASLLAWGRDAICRALVIAAMAFFVLTTVGLQLTPPTWQASLTLFGWWVAALAGVTLTIWAWLRAHASGVLSRQQMTVWLGIWLLGVSQCWWFMAAGPPPIVAAIASSFSLFSIGFGPLAIASNRHR